MKIFDKIICKLARSLVHVSTVSVTSAYLLLLCSASQCNKHERSHEQALIASEQSVGGEDSSSAADKVRKRSQESKVKEKEDEAMSLLTKASERLSNPNYLQDFKDESDESDEDDEDDKPRKRIPEQKSWLENLTNWFSSDRCRSNLSQKNQDHMRNILERLSIREKID
jgi:hypothetical protein